MRWKWEMSSKPLDKLEKLAGQRADQSHRLFEQEMQQLQTIDQHRAELHVINSEYQQGPVGRTDVAPQLLAQRRAFVEQLTRKLDELRTQREQKRQMVQTRMHEHQQHTAQHAAIELISEKRIDELKIAGSRQEMQQLDEVARGRHYQQQALNKEQSND